MLEPKTNRTLIVGPRGQMVMVKKGAKLKPGWRYATEADVKAKEASEVKNKAEDAKREAAEARAAAVAQAAREKAEG